MSEILQGAGVQVARAAGSVAAGVFAVAGRVRRSPKPLHPTGSVLTAVLHRHGLAEPTGVAWIDEPGSSEVLVRLSRSIGVPAPWPDFLGLAIRIPFDGGRWGDLLMTTTGQGTTSRFVLVPHRDVDGASFGTLMPYQSERGSLVFGAVATRAAGQLRVTLSVGAPRGPLRDFAAMDIDEAKAHQPDEPVSFDAVRNPPPGLEPSEWISRLREKSYAVARRSRNASLRSSP
jgi:hypothetical protein